MARKRQPDERKLRTREHVLADLSINYVERQILLCGFAANRLHTDYGIDLLKAANMATNRITYKQFDDLLIHLGFSRKRVEDKWLRYEHKPSELVIVVAAKEPNDLVRVTDAVSARRHLAEKEVIGSKELDELLSQNSVPEPSGKKA